jgi:hypothetical protein
MKLEQNGVQIGNKNLGMLSNKVANQALKVFMLTIGLMVTCKVGEQNMHFGYGCLS